jgi:cytochrome c-type biogenesis protein CcmH
MSVAFWTLALLFVAGAVVLIILPLLRSGSGVAAVPVDTEDLSLTVFQQQLRDLEADLANGVLEQSQFERARADLERGLLEDAVLPDTDRPQPTRGSPLGGRITAAVLAVAVPAVALATYLHVGGGTGTLDPQRQQPAMAAAAPEHDMARLVEELRIRLTQQPDPQGLALLARSLASLGRLEEAAEAYAQAVELGADSNPSILAQYADLLAFLSDGFEGRPLELVEQALALDPDHPQALWLAGTAAYRDNDYAAARGHWERLLAGLPPDSDAARTIESNLAELGQREGAGD